MGHGKLGTMSESIDVRINVTDVRLAKEQMRELGENVVGDMDDLWDRIANVMVDVSTYWFETEGKGKWEPLAPSTIAWKQANNKPLDILIRDFNLLDSLTTPEAARIGGYRSTLGTFEPHTFSWGTEVRDEHGRQYAHFHQQVDPRTGLPFTVTTSKGDFLPQRQVIEWPLGEDTERLIENAMNEWLEDQVREAGIEAEV